MFDSYLIEIDDLEAGLLLRQGEAFVFHAVAPRFRAFEGAVFADPWSAERALRRHAQRPTPKRDGARDPGAPRRVPPAAGRRALG
ncbi:hypothetical protein EYW49_14095 [Siculibacillus lacustris]|uniref:Uncharacterized protein n=1 Tax=Siculibacillus lacustris TaxID=1549641 RepID=A0A4Q9VN10_9HYPH|nr:hypothetical protein [Siculibacillus lacustris]TBW36465.1 hypothetical protein EYW49_14095 [Siculibacillus lacustris]